MLNTVIAYALTLGMVLFAAMGLPASLFGALSGRRSGVWWSSLIGFTIAWLIVAGLWYWLEGGHLPLVLLAVAMAALFVNAARRKGRRTRTSRSMLAGEALAIALVAVSLFYLTDPVRWI